MLTPKPAINWPRTTDEATAFFQQGEPLAWFAELPERLQSIWSWELLHLYKKFVANKAIAAALEHKGDELAAIYKRLTDELEAQGLTFCDLKAFDCTVHDMPVFGYSTPDYILPSFVPSAPGKR